MLEPGKTLHISGISLYCPCDVMKIRKNISCGGGGGNDGGSIFPKEKSFDISINVKKKNINQIKLELSLSLYFCLSFCIISYHFAPEAVWHWEIDKIVCSMCHNTLLSVVSDRSRKLSDISELLPCKLSKFMAYCTISAGKEQRDISPIQ